MTISKIQPSITNREDTVIRKIMEGTASETGEQFFLALVENLATVLNVLGAWVTEFIADEYKLRARAFWLNGKFVSHYEYDIAGTPCEPVVCNKEMLHIDDNVIELFPNDPDLPSLNAVSYMGAPLLDSDKQLTGHLAVLNDKPMKKNSRDMAIFKIFAARAAAEMNRIRVEFEVRERELQLSSLFTNAIDAVIEFNNDFTITRSNPAATKIFQCDTGDLSGQDLSQFLTDKGKKKIQHLITELGKHPPETRAVWIPDGLQVVNCRKQKFPAEATLSCYEVRQQSFHVLIMRNVNKKLEAEKKIQALTAEAEYLREELREFQCCEGIIGESEDIIEILQDVEQVAGTESTVLVTGETGTGKEVVVRAIHQSSQRQDKPFIRVNCPAIPDALIESEFFGHEKGAFTGATTKRDGRFALADGGTIFLDEIGELPPHLQVNLLRVIQEGEFEPVGSSQTKRVDVRIIAATNRDLEQEVKEGRFREDLFYRLNVFPIKIPPLRVRGNDIILLAEYFIDRYAYQSGRSFNPLSAEDINRLKAYIWPGNIRELQNVIERAVVTSRDSRLNLYRALPEALYKTDTHELSTADSDQNTVRTMRELQEMERENIIRALEVSNWKVSGENGAAKMLDIPPTTLNSRIKALDIKRQLV
jgi:PAS domain S-box-containing protein